MTVRRVDAPDGTLVPDRETFGKLAAEYPVVPVTRRVLADGETPVGTYRKLAGGPGTFLLESAEPGRAWSRYSFIGVRSVTTLSERDGEAVWSSPPPLGLPTGGNSLEVLQACAHGLRAPRLEGMPPLMGGLVGYLAYDFVRRIERLPEHAVADLDVPELTMLLTTDLAVLDHQDGSCLLVANALDGDYDDAVARLDAMAVGLAQPAAPTVATTSREAVFDFRSRTPAGSYRPAVEAALEYVRAGDIFQAQIGQRFEVATSADALDIYRMLRATNPSPYMYLVRLDGPDGPLDVVGSSPESLVTVVRNGSGNSSGSDAGLTARLHPIAGTRPRGATPEQDAELAAELVGDAKERAEHVMLVDLGRNDLGRVCEPGTVRVLEFGAVERYSHVMHIVSTVVGEVASGRTAVDVLAACFPAGTLSGAPKVRAMEIIDELEPVRRGIYGGGVGYLDFAGDLDLAIAIRTAVLRGGTAYVQAAAGIVADSDPAMEEAETQHKATAVLRAIAMAENLRPPS
ncbi:MAG: anthranilate synthase component [Frankiaceae bacterium]|nr:anthranilate synthase component [Frankiaceae bacterium]